MNKQTEPVDVLAVMDRAAREAVPLKFALEVDDARAAIAELIEAASAYRATICTYKASWKSHDAVLQRRLDDAIANVRGAK